MAAALDVLPKPVLLVFGQCPEQRAVDVEILDLPQVAGIWNEEDDENENGYDGEEPAFEE